MGCGLCVTDRHTDTHRGATELDKRHGHKRFQKGSSHSLTQFIAFLVHALSLTQQHTAQAQSSIHSESICGQESWVSRCNSQDPAIVPVKGPLLQSSILTPTTTSAILHTHTHEHYTPWNLAIVNTVQMKYLLRVNCRLYQNLTH